MTFKEGLLKARGQIAFITALAISTAVIIRLETLDTEDRIQSRVTAEIARRNSAQASAPAPLEAAVRSSLRKAEDAYGADPAASVNRAALLTSLSAALQLGMLKPDEGLTRATRIIDDLEKQPASYDPMLSAALTATAVAFPVLQERVSGLISASH